MKNPMSMIASILLLFTLGFSVGALVAQVEAQSELTASSKLVPEAKKLESAEVKALKEQIQLMRTFENQLLGTVHWALGIVFLVSTLLIGVNWLAIMRAQRQDTAALRAILQLHVNETVGAAREDLQELIEEKTKELVDIGNAHIVELKKKEESFGEIVKKEIAHQLLSVQRNLDYLKMYHARMDVRVGNLEHMSEGQLFLKYVHLLEAAVGIDFGPDVSEALEGLNKTIGGARPAPAVRSSLEQTFKRMSDQYSQEIVILRDKIKEVS